MIDNAMANKGDEPMDRVSAANRLSIRAILVSQGEDPTAALAAAGIVNAVAIPVVVGEELDLSRGILGNGRTPNLIAVLETEQDEEFGASVGKQQKSVRPAADAAQSTGPVTVNLPAAFGIQPIAPGRTRRG